MRADVADWLYNLSQRARVWVLRLRFAFRDEWFVYDWVDKCVHYQGTYRRCCRVIDELPGGYYSVVSGVDYDEYLSPF